MGEVPVSDDACNKLEDLSGMVLRPGDNPYAAFIEGCHDSHVLVQKCIIRHKLTLTVRKRSRLYTRLIASSVMPNREPSSSPQTLVHSL